jgi:hypothetical protein
VRAAVGSKGDLFGTTNGTDPSYHNPFDPKGRLPIREDWFAGGGGGAALGNYNWSHTASNGQINGQIQSVAGTANQGIMRQRLVTSSTAYSILHTYLMFSVGGGQIKSSFLVRLEDLNNGTDDARAQWGLGNSLTAAQHTQGVNWMYDSASTKFQFCTTASSTTTATALGSDVVADTWYLLEYLVNDDGTSVIPYINGTAYTAQTTNIPATSTVMYFGSALGKTAGTGIFDMYTDYLLFDQLFSGNRHT